LRRRRNAVRTRRYKPARQGGRAVRAIWDTTVVFKLEP